MKADAALISVFVDEAVRYLALSEDDGSSDAERAEAIDSLEQAVELLGDDHDAVRARHAVAAVRTDRVVGASALAELARELRRRVTEPAPRADAEPAPPLAPGRATSDSDVDEPWSSSEYDLLRSFFRDEAHQALEAVARKVLDAGPQHIDDAAFEDIMRTTHSLKGSAGTVGLTEFADAAHQLEDAIDRLRRGKLPWSRAASDALVETIDAMREYVDGLSADGGERRPAARLREQIEALGALRRAEPADLTVVPRPRPDTDAPPDDSPGEDRRQKERRRDDIPLLRVDPSRIDRLMDSVGELVFDRTRIERRVRELSTLADDLTATRRAIQEQIAGLGEAQSFEREVLAGRLGEIEADLAQQVAVIRRATSTLLDDTEALRRTGVALQDGLTSVRMQTVRSLFQLLAPQLRSISRAAGKRVKLFTAGGETEFDKAVAEQITDPLIQLMRNALAHGIEPARVRAERGKPEEGQITIAARYEGSMVVLEVSDDGAGIDPARLRERLIDSGRWSQSRTDLASDDEVLRAIFEPGVSSLDQADHLAGRGFGLDAVRATIARLGGEIRVRSAVGRGTTFTLRFPLTTAITNALLFKCGGDVYAVPNVHVVQTAHVESSAPTVPSHVSVGGKPVPLVALHGVLGAVMASDVRKVPAVVIEYLGRRLAITCDKIVGPREIVLKNLGPLLAPLPLYAGGTISGSGKVQLILDPAALVALAYPEAATGQAVGDPASARRGPAQPGRVLVADDSRAIREAMTRMLERAGYVVDVAEDGASAWQLLCNLRYDVLVTDLEMPQLDGFALIERLRADAELSRLPVIVISSRTTAANRDRASGLGVVSFLAKPVSHDQLVGALDRLR